MVSTASDTPMERATAAMSRMPAVEQPTPQQLVVPSSG